MGMFADIGNRWNEMMNDPVQKQAFQQFALNLMQSKPGITPFQNIGEAIQSSQAYITQLRELERQKKLEEEKMQLARENLQVSKDELSANTAYRQGQLSLGERERRDNRLERVGRLSSDRLDRQSRERVAGMEAATREKVAKIDNEASGNKEFAVTKRINDMAQDIITIQSPTATPEQKALAEARIKASLSLVSPGSGPYAPQVTDTSWNQPNFSDVQQQMFANLVRVGQGGPVPAPGAPAQGAPIDITPPAAANSKYKEGSIVSNTFRFNGKIQDVRVVRVNRDGSIIVQSVENPGLNATVPASALK